MISDRPGDRLQQRASNTDVKKSEQLMHNLSGGFTPDVFETLRSRPALVSELALRGSEPALSVDVPCGSTQCCRPGGSVRANSSTAARLH
jgi:hypothetical protein